jgi:hypothetical protein
MQIMQERGSAEEECCSSGCFAGGSALVGQQWLCSLQEQRCCSISGSAEIQFKAKFALSTTAT